MNQVYGLFKQGLLEGKFNLLGNAVVAVLVDTGLYTANFSTDEFLSVVPLAARVAQSAGLTGKTTTLGTFDAQDVTFDPIAPGLPTCEALVLVQWTGDPATSRLIEYVDSAIGLPLTPSGAPALVQWSNAPERILKVG